MATESIPSEGIGSSLDKLIELAYEAYDRGVEKFEKAMKARKARQELNQFSKRELADMGLTQGDIDRMVDEHYS